jgi:hypothetical protein
MSLIIAILKRMRACEEKSKGELGEKGVPGCTTKTCRRNMGKEKRGKIRHSIGLVHLNLSECVGSRVKVYIQRG